MKAFRGRLAHTCWMMRHVCGEQPRLHAPRAVGTRLVRIQSPGSFGTLSWPLQFHYAPVAPSASVSGVSRFPAGVVFDCDGLLLDTEECWTRGEVRLFAGYGHEFTARHKRLLLGAAGQIAGGILARELEQPGRGDELLEELVALAWKEIAAGVAPRPHAAELVRELRGRLPLALASNSPRGLVDVGLESAGLDGCFDVVLGSDDVANPKPAPDLYLAACERLGVRPEEAVALEDSPTGVASALAAGLHVIGVPSLPGVALEASETATSLGDASVRRALGLADLAA